MDASSMLHQPSPPPPSSVSSSTRLLPPVNVDSYVRELGQWDVLLGRGTGPTKHSGNKYFRQVVKQQTEAYFASTNRKEKDDILQATINIIKKKKKGRFLLKLEKHETDGEAIYHLADSTTQIEKTKHAFIYACKKGIKDRSEDDVDEVDEDSKRLERPNKNVRTKKQEDPRRCRPSSWCDHPTQVKKARMEDEAAVSSSNSSSVATGAVVPATLGRESSPQPIPAFLSTRGVIIPPPVASHMNLGAVFSNIISKAPNYAGAATTGPSFSGLPSKNQKLLSHHQAIHSSSNLACPSVQEGQVEDISTHVISPAEALPRDLLIPGRFFPSHAAPAASGIGSFLRHNISNQHTATRLYGALAELVAAKNEYRRRHRCDVKNGTSAASDNTSNQHTPTRHYAALAEWVAAKDEYYQGRLNNHSYHNHHKGGRGGLPF